MQFKNRNEAGELLANALDAFRSTPAVVCPLPRGGVALGVVVARQNFPDPLVAIPSAISSTVTNSGAIARREETTSLC